MRLYLRDPQGCPFVFAPFAIEPVRGMRPDIEMKKALAEAKTGEADRMGGGGERALIMLAKRDVEGELFVQRQGCAADAGIVQQAAMARIDVQRRVHRHAQPFERIERIGPDMDLAATGAGDFTWREVRPALEIPRLGRLHVVTPKKTGALAGCRRDEKLLAARATATRAPRRASGFRRASP